MGGPVPKQFLPLAGRPVLMRTLERLHEALPEARLVVSLPASERGRWKALCEEYGFGLEHITVDGGTERFFSVLAALDACGGCDLVAVHDGVRPLAPAAMVRRLVEEAEIHGSAAPVVIPADSFRIVEGDGALSKPVARSLLRAVQTPQVFRTALLREAYRMAEKAGGAASSGKAAFTDDSSVIEYAGHTVHLSAGDERNIKITRQIDLKIAEALLKYE